MCSSLVRLAVSITNITLEGIVTGRIQASTAAVVDLLMKAGANPMVHVSAGAIHMLSKIVAVDHSLSARLLPLLQHRAIIPYIMKGQVPSLGAAEVSGVDFPEYEAFRDITLREALTACFVQNPSYFLDSCTSAVEEFCSSSSTVEVSFQLEAALFCIRMAANGILSDDTWRSEGLPERGAGKSASPDDQLRRCTKSLAIKPAFLAANPLALAQLNRFIGQVRILMIYVGLFEPACNQLYLGLCVRICLCMANVL